MTATRIMRIAAAFLAASALAWHAGALAAVIKEVRVSFNPATITVDETSDLRIEIKTSQGNIDAGMDIEVPLRGLFSVGAMTFQGCKGEPESFSTGTAVIITGLKSHPGRICQMSIRIGAPSPGTYEFTEGWVVVTSEGKTTGNSEAATLVVLAAPPPVLVASPRGVAFGTQLVGTTSAAQTVTLSNAGGSPLAISGISTSGDFHHGDWDCETSSIPAGGSCALSVAFTPTTIGSRTGALQIASDASSSPLVVDLSGTGIEADRTLPKITLLPAALDFGTITAGSTSLLRVVLESTGTEPLAISAIDITGAGFSQSNSQSNQCPGSLPPGASCDIWIAFAPQAAGLHAGVLSVGSNATDGAGTVPLSGTATPEPEPTIAFSRSTVSFGDQTLGISSNPQAILVSNPGDVPLDLVSIGVTGDFGFEGCATPLSLFAGESCELAVRFLPTAAGIRSGTISVSSNAAASPHAIALNGNGTPVPVPGIVVAPAAVDFGSTLAGASVTAHLVLTNTGTAPLAIEAISSSAAVFTHSGTCPPSLPPSAACDITVTYAPTAEGSHVGELRIASNAVPSPLVVPLAGRATPAHTPLLQLSSSSVVFGTHFVGVTSPPRTVTLLNAGLAPLTITNIVSTGDFGYAGCGFPTTLPAGGSCIFSITFKPLSVGALTGAIEIASNAPDGPHTITIAGTGASFAVAEISLQPSHVSFGPQSVGSAVTQRMALTNAGGTALQISAITATGAFFTQSNDCPASLAVGASCEIAATYAPTAIGAHHGQVLITSNAVPSPHVVALAGSAVALPPAFLAVDRLVDFGEQATGTTAREALRLGNTGGEPLSITAARILGAPEFGLEGHCATIMPGASCTLEVTFTPTGARTFTARLDIVSNHSAGVVQVALAGDGVPRPQAALELSVEGLGWGNQVVGTPGEARVVRLTSVGGEDLHIHSIAATPDFVVDAGQCPGVLAPRLSCEVSVTFKPIVPGPRLGRLLILSNAAGSTGSVSLTGVGCRFFTMGAARNPARLCAP
jgi:hypothetical protein